MATFTGFNGTFSVNENQTILIDSDVTIAGTAAEFNGAKVTVSGLLAEDRVGLSTQGSIAASGGTVLFNSVAIGTYTGGTGAPFVVTFNGNATAAAVEATIEHLTFGSASEAPTASRSISVTLQTSDTFDAFTTSSNVTTAAGDVGAYSAPAFADLYNSATGTVIGAGSATADGRPDLITGGLINGDTKVELRLYTQNANGTYARVTGSADPFSALNASNVNANTADFNYGATGQPVFANILGDARPELILAYSQLTNGNTVTSYLVTYTLNSVGQYVTATSLGFTDPLTVATNSTVSEAFAFSTFGDFDGDGDIDFAVTRSNAIDLYSNNGNNTFTAAGRMVGNTGGNDFPRPLIGSDDINKDGRVDLVVFANEADRTGEVYYSSGSGTLSASTFVLSTAASPFTASGTGQTIVPAFGDVDNDGDRDVVYGNENGTFTFQNRVAGTSVLNSTAATVNSVNDAPTFTASGAAASYTENAAAVQIASGVTLSDVENNSFVTLAVSITGNLVTGDRLSLPTSGNVIVDTGSGAVTVGGVTIGSVTTLTTSAATVTFNANATAARIIALTEAVGFLSLSDDPTAATRSVTFTISDNGGTANGGVANTSFVRTVAVTPADDPRTATADTTTTAENTAIAGNVLTNDPDPDGGPASTVSAVNGSTTSVGTTVTLASGAQVIVSAAGNYTYNPNGAFNYLVAPGGSTGGQSSATDSFTYTVAGGATATVTVTITGVSSSSDQIRGSAGSETLTGTGGADYIDIRQGGTDTVNAGDGDDLIFAGPGFDSTDVVNGGVGNDQVGLFGSYTGSLGNVTNTEYLAVLSGTSTRFGGDGTPRYTYNLTTTDATVAAGVSYTVQANELVAGENLRFDGSAETDGSFRVFAGKGVDTLIGGAGADGFFFGEGGRFTAADQVNGNGGIDQIGLRGNYSTAVTFTATTLTNVEAIVLLSASDAGAAAEAGAYTYRLVLNDATVASGETLTVNAAQLRSGEVANINGATETNGKFTFIGGQGADVFVGGAGADTLYGGLGADMLTGGGGSDVFLYRAAAESGPGAAARDTITDFQTGDLIDVSVIDAIAGGADNPFAFIGSAAFSGAGQIRATLVSGSNWLVEGDIDGNGVADFSINVTTDHAIVATDFIL